MTHEEQIKNEIKLWNRLIECYREAMGLELDDLAEAISEAEHELAKVMIKHPELGGAE